MRDARLDVTRNDHTGLCRKRSRQILTALTRPLRLLLLAYIARSFFGPLMAVCCLPVPVLFGDWIGSDTLLAVGSTQHSAAQHSTANIGSYRHSHLVYWPIKTSLLGSYPHHSTSPHPSPTSFAVASHRDHLKVVGTRHLALRLRLRALREVRTALTRFLPFVRLSSHRYSTCLHACCSALRLLEQSPSPSFYTIILPSSFSHSRQAFVLC